MFWISPCYTTPPVGFETPLQKAAYQALQALEIPFIRVNTDEAITMEDCVQINEKLNMKMVKTLFLCNQQKTDFYLFITVGDKPFCAKAFRNALGAPRVSFAPAQRMEEMLGVKTGAATIFSVLLDQENKIRVVLDQEVVHQEWYGCSDGTTNCYMKLKTADMIGTFLPFTGHAPAVIEV